MVLAVLALLSLSAAVVVAAIVVLASRPRDDAPGAGRAARGTGAWKCAALTVYESYPTSAEEASKYNGATWAGMFAALSGKQSREWVAKTNIAAVHSRDFDGLKLKNIEVRDPDSGRTLVAKVYDKCADSDCGGCCTRNANKFGCDFLVDLEASTAKRLLGSSGPVMKRVEWRPA